MNVDNIIYRVAERFISINGESRRAGEAAVFIRFAGCNVRCSYCDTLWALDAGVAREMTGRDIIDYVLGSGISNVTLTGGEPLIQPHIAELIEGLLTETAVNVEVETNGCVDAAPVLKAVLGESAGSPGHDADIGRRLSFTYDYKCPGSGVEDRMVTENLSILRPEDTVKFVVSDKRDLDRMCEVIDSFSLSGRCAIYVSCVFGRIEPREAAEYIIDKRLNGIRLQLQIHKYIWEPDMRGV